MNLEDIVWRLKNEPEWIILGLLLLFFLVGGGGYYYYNHYQSTQKAHTYFNRILRQYTRAQKPEEYKKVIRQFRQLASRFSGSAIEDKVYFFLGKSYYRQREYKKAVKSFRRIINNHQESFFLPAAYLHTGYSYYQLDKNKLALNQFQQLATRLAPTHPLWPEARWQEAQVYKRLGEKEKARRILRKIVEHSGNKNRYWSQRARSLLADFAG